MCQCPLVTVNLRCWQVRSCVFMELPAELIGVITPLQALNNTLCPKERLTVADSEVRECTKQQQSNKVWQPHKQERKQHHVDKCLNTVMPAVLFGQSLICFEDRVPMYSFFFIRRKKMGANSKAGLFLCSLFTLHFPIMHEILFVFYPARHQWVAFEEQMSEMRV